jgi:hypothetical protein
VFQKGQSGNPRGRPRGRHRSVNVEERELRTLATEFGPAVFKRLIRLCASQNESVAVRACEAVLDRCYGKPPQAVEVSGDVSPVVVT